MSNVFQKNHNKNFTRFTFPNIEQTDDTKIFEMNPNNRENIGFNTVNWIQPPRYYDDPPTYNELFSGNPNTQNFM